MVLWLLDGVTRQHEAVAEYYRERGQVPADDEQEGVERHPKPSRHVGAEQPAGGESDAAAYGRADDVYEHGSMVLWLNGVPAAGSSSMARRLYDFGSPAVIAVVTSPSYAAIASRNLLRAAIARVDLAPSSREY